MKIKLATMLINLFLLMLTACVIAVPRAEKFSVEPQDARFSKIKIDECELSIPTCTPESIQYKASSASANFLGLRLDPKATHTIEFYNCTTGPSWVWISLITLGILPSTMMTSECLRITDSGGNAVFESRRESRIYAWLPLILVAPVYSPSRALIENQREMLNEYLRGNYP